MTPKEKATDGWIATLPLRLIAAFECLFCSRFSLITYNKDFSKTSTTNVNTITK